MTKSLIVGDVHLSKTPPGRRTSSYYEDILAKLDHIVEIAREQKVDQVIFVGDLYHNPRADRVQHEVTKAMSVRVRALEVPVYVDPGNHDMRNGDLKAVYVSQPIALLDELPNVTLLGWEPVEAVGDVVLYPVPGVPHIEDVETYRVPKEGQALDADKFHLQVVHQSIARDGAGSLPFEHTGAEEIAEVTSVDMVVYGHLHEDFGLYEVGGVKFANFGSICRGSIGESDLKKVPKVMVLETSGSDYVGFELFELRHRPAADVFRLEEYLNEKAKSKDMEDFVSSLERISVQTFSLDGVISSIGQRDDVAADVRDYAVDCINQVRT